MKKEEYAQLHYLLGKLKYSIAEVQNNLNRKVMDDAIEKINDIERVLILDESSEIKLKVGDD